MYGISQNDLEQTTKKLKIQKKYLEDSFFFTKSGQVKTLLEVSFHANHSSRYYAEIINKINTINTIILTEAIEYQPIFLTITLDGFFRGFLKGDFSRYDERKHSHLIPNDEQRGFLRDKIARGERFNIKELYNCLNHQVKRFQQSSPYKNISKSGYKAHYIKVTEPHKKDGVPHMHMMLYIPKIHTELLLEAYIKYFPAPQNLKPLKDKSGLSCKLGQINGFQWEIKSAPAYILKYLFKSFRNVKNNEELDELQSWYVTHRILRVVTSHSLIPAWIYRKVMPLEKDWFYLTDIKRNGICEWSSELDYFILEDENKKVLEYNQGVFKYIVHGKVIKEFGEKKYRPSLVIKLQKTIKRDIKKDVEVQGCFPANEDNRYVFDKDTHKLTEKKKGMIALNYMTNSQLLAYERKLENGLDVKNLSIEYEQRLELLDNEIIKRGL